MTRPGSLQLDSLFRGAAEAVVACLTCGPAAAPPAACAVARPFLQRLYPVLLAMKPDASGAAEEDCRKLRSDVADALRQAVTGCSTPDARSLAGGTRRGIEQPWVWVEVRHTAGRWMPAGAAFTVGTDDGCDIQVAGDATVSALQCLVVPLPGGTVVIDAWSSALPTRRYALANHFLPEQETPLAGQQQLIAFILPPGQRTILVVGERTTLTLGRPAAGCSPAAASRRLATTRASDGHGATLALATAAPQLPAFGRDHPAPPCEGLTSLLEELPLDVYPSGVRRTVRVDGQSSVLQQSAAQQASTSSAGGSHSLQARLRRCLAAVHASVRLRLLSMKSALQLRQHKELHAEVRWRCLAAHRAGLLMEKQCRKLEAQLLPGNSRSAAREVLKVLDLLGAPQQPKLQLEARGGERPRCELALPLQVHAASAASAPQEQHHCSMAGTSAVAFLTTHHCMRSWSGHLHKCRATVSAALARALRSAVRGRILVRLRKAAASAFNRVRPGACIKQPRPRGHHRSDCGLKACAARGHCFTQQLLRPNKMIPHMKLACPQAVLQPLGQSADQPPSKKGKKQPQGQ